MLCALESGEGGMGSDGGTAAVTLTLLGTVGVVGALGVVLVFSVDVGAEGSVGCPAESGEEETIKDRMTMERIVLDLKEFIVLTT